MTRDTKLYARRTIVRKLAIDDEALDRLEELQIVVPVRRPGRERAYFSEDVDILRVYAVLTRELDVNQAGAEIILRMRNRLLTVRQRMVQVLSEARAQGLLEELQEIIEAVSRDDL